MATPDDSARRYYNLVQRELTYCILVASRARGLEAEGLVMLIILGLGILLARSHSSMRAMAADFGWRG